MVVIDGCVLIGAVVFCTLIGLSRDGQGAKVLRRKYGEVLDELLLIYY